MIFLKLKQFSILIQFKLMSLQQYQMGNCNSQQIVAPILTNPFQDQLSPPQISSNAQNSSFLPLSLPQAVIGKSPQNPLQQNSRAQHFSSSSIVQPAMISVLPPQPLPLDYFSPIIHNPQIVRNISICSLNSSSQNIAAKDDILQDFVLIKELTRMLDGVCFTENQAKDLFKPLIQGIKILQQVESQEEKEVIRLAFNQSNIEQIKDEKLFYNGMLDKLKERLIGQSIKSRVHHTIANIKKGKRIEKVWMNQHKITCLQSNAYKELSESELQEVVQYETLADKTREIGQKVGFKLSSIKKQSQKMISLLVKCVLYHIEDIDQLKYDLSEKQVMKMAKMSREACKYYDNGAYILLVYFVQSCRRLQEQSKNTSEIESLLKKAIQLLSKEYPPGEGLSKERKELVQTLKKLQDPKTYHKVEFIHQEIKLTSTNKQKQVEQIIDKYAQIAEQSKDLLEKLIKATCLSKCVYFRIGLKYYPSKPNQKAATRIKEKMFFSKEDQYEKEIIGSTIRQVLQKEQAAYRSIIDQILKTFDSLQFTISDMVRAKCVFLDVGDIIETVNEIKKFVAKDHRYGISEIESRFKNAIPISDVTLKIVLNKQIVGELQLTIQTNAATYNFAHKIYELQRSKVFSKLKIVHNYYQESRSDFNESAKKALQLEAINSTIDKQNMGKIRSYFRFDANTKPLQNILQEVVEENRESITHLKISVDPNLQHLFLVAFNLALGRWGNTIGKIINQSLKQEQLSPKLKSVILSIFFEVFQLPTQSVEMQQHYLQDKELSKKVYLDEYIKKSFMVERALQYSNENQRLFQRVLELKQVIFYKKQYSQIIELKEHFFAQNIVIQNHCFQKIKKLKELFYFYFLTRRHDHSIYFECSYYSKWIEEQLKHNRDPEIETLRNECTIIKAQYLSQQKKPELVKECLEDVLKMLKSREQYSKAIDCQILLAQSYIKTNSKHSLQSLFQIYEKNVVQKASLLGLQLKGPLYADSLWRISSYLWQKSKSSESRKQLLRSFYKRAIIQMSRSKGRQFVQALGFLCKQNEAYKIETPQMLENTQIKYANLSQLGAYACKCFFNRAKWKNINALNLFKNSLGSAECRLLSQADWKNITKLNLNSNNIGNEGCQFISKANWKNIAFLSLSQNSIGFEGCQSLSKADWKYMTTLQIMVNYFGAKGCQNLSKADWKNLKTLNLSVNEIGDQGCYFISKADWKKITELFILDNKIGDEGCLHLSQADWKDLTILQLHWNRIGDEGCEYLSRADWKNLSTLAIDYNKIGDVGCQYLSMGKWHNLKELKLGHNQIRMKQPSLTKLFTQNSLRIQ